MAQIAGQELEIAMWGYEGMMTGSVGAGFMGIFGVLVLIFFVLGIAALMKYLRN